MRARDIVDRILPPPPARRVTLSGMAFLARRTPPAATKPKGKPQRKMPVWETPSGVTVSAWTKSEARAKVKQRVGTDSLPKGYTLTRIA